MKYRAVCFDIDGTLYEPSVMRRNLLLCWLRHPMIFSRYRRMRRDFRRLQEGRRFCGGLDMLTREALVMLGRYGELECSESEAQAISSDPFVASMRKTLNDKCYRTMTMVSGGLKAREGVAGTLARLKGMGIAVGVFSDFPIEGKLAAMGLENLVDFKCDSMDCGYLKPDERCFDYLSVCGNITNYDGCEKLYVGDSYAKDYLGARRCGWDAALIGGDDKKEAGAELVFSDWHDFDRWLFASMEG